MMEKKIREKGLRIAKRIENATKTKTEFGVTSSGEMLFYCYCYNNNFDYVIIKVSFEEDRTDLSYLKEINQKAKNDDYLIYRASDLEKEVVRYINENKISNAWVCEGDLHVEMEDIKLDPIDLKYYTEFNIEVDEDGELELTIKYKYDNDIYIVNNGNELYVEEYDENGNECCVYCHNEFLDECICDSNEDVNKIEETLKSLKLEIAVLRRENQKLKNLIKDKEVIKEIENESKETFRNARCLENLFKNINMSQEEIIEKSKELDEYFERFKLMNNIRF